MQSFPVQFTCLLLTNRRVLRNQYVANQNFGLLVFRFYFVLFNFNMTASPLFKKANNAHIVGPICPAKLWRPQLDDLLALPLWRIPAPMCPEEPLPAQQVNETATSHWELQLLVFSHTVGSLNIYNLLIYRHLFLIGGGDELCTT